MISSGSLLAVALAACSSSSAHPSADAPTTTTSVAAGASSSSSPSSDAATNGSTVDPNSEVNPIPYNVGEPIGLSDGWRVEVLRVQRTATLPGLPAPPTGSGYVTVDIRFANVEGKDAHFDSAELFALFDQSNNSHPVIARPGVPNPLDGVFPRGATRTGTLLFTAPVRSQLLMTLDGQKIGSQRSLFQIDPPEGAPRD